MRSGARAAYDLARAPALARRIASRVTTLAAAPRAAAPLDVGGSPVYLRTDLWFGFRAGGSVGHVAGVVNELGRFGGPAVVITSDWLPLVRPDVELHRIAPTREFWDFAELPALRYNETLLPAARRLLRGRRVSFVYQRYSLGNLSGVELSRELGVPLVLEFNGSELWVSRNWGRPLRRESLMGDIERLALRGADLVVAVSDGVRAQALEQGVDPARILVNPNGVDTDRYSPEVDGGPVRARYGLDGMMVIGFIGTFGTWHGAEVLAEAFALYLRQHPEERGRVRLLMIGDGTGLPRARAALEAGGAAREAIFTGVVPQEEGARHLAACDIVVSPQLPNADGTPFFGSPTKLFEYMAMGRAILASRLDQIAETIRHGENGWLVEPGSARSLADGIRALAADPALRRRLGDAARRDAVERHGWAEHTRRIVDALAARAGRS
jgi:glycosyltransferase involved in cell wall biosynthesis